VCVCVCVSCEFCESVESVCCKCVFATLFLCVRACVRVTHLQPAPKATARVLFNDFVVVDAENEELQDDADDVEGTRCCVQRG
jgi:hypothetical protein